MTIAQRIPVAFPPNRHGHHIHLSLLILAVCTTSHTNNTAGQNSAQQFQLNRRFATFCSKDKTLRTSQRSRGKVFVLSQGIRKDF